MAKTVYPDARDLAEYLIGAGFDENDVTAMALPEAILAGRQSIERDTGRKFLAAAADETRRYDPPTTRESVLWIDDLATLTSVQYQPLNATATTLILNEDYWPEPYNAALRVLPFNRIRFRRLWREPLGSSLRRSLLIAGKYGWGTQGDTGTGYPDEVWLAIIQAGALSIFEQLSMKFTGGLESWREDDVAENYGERWEALAKGWKARVCDVVRKYRREWL